MRQFSVGEVVIRIQMSSFAPRLMAITGSLPRCPIETAITCTGLKVLLTRRTRREGKPSCQIEGLLPEEVLKQRPRQPSITLPRLTVSVGA